MQMAMIHHRQLRLRLSGNHLRHHHHLRQKMNYHHLHRLR
jgi:hypothetical protein